MNIEKPTETNEQNDLSGDVLVRRSNGDIVKGKAIKNRLLDNGVEYVVLYEVEGETRRHIFRQGELEAMQLDISEQMESEAAVANTYTAPVTETEALDRAMQEKEEFAQSVRGEASKMQLGSEAIKGSGMITVPSSVQTSNQEQREQEVIAKPDSQPLIDMPEDLH